MDDNIGSLFNELRKSKRIPVNTVTGDHLSRSQYHRFVKNESDISLSKFIFILEKINIQFEEFMFLLPQKHNDLRTSMQKIINCFQQQSPESLLLLENEFVSFFQDTYQIKYQHLYLICRALRKRLTKKKLDNDDVSVIEDYLLNVDTWTHYELTLFNNIFFIFNPDKVLLLSKTAAKKTKVFSEYFPNIQECVLLYSNIIIYFLEREKVSYVSEIIQNLNYFKVEENHLYEKLLIKFWLLIDTYLLSKEQENLVELDKLTKFLIYLDSGNLAKMLEGVIQFVVNFEKTAKKRKI